MLICLGFVHIVQLHLLGSKIFEDIGFVLFVFVSLN